MADYFSMSISNSVISPVRFKSKFRLVTRCNILLLHTICCIRSNNRTFKWPRVWDPARNTSTQPDSVLNIVIVKFVKDPNTKKNLFNILPTVKQCRFRPNDMNCFIIWFYLNRFAKWLIMQCLELKIIDCII